jgi:hypothetical protein
VEATSLSSLHVACEGGPESTIEDASMAALTPAPADRASIALPSLTATPDIASTDATEAALAQIKHDPLLSESEKGHRVSRLLAEANAYTLALCAQAHPGGLRA